jgi:hypothetical protein
MSSKETGRLVISQLEYFHLVGGKVASIEICQAQGALVKLHMNHLPRETTRVLLVCPLEAHLLQFLKLWRKHGGMIALFTNLGGNHSPVARGGLKISKVLEPPPKFSQGRGKLMRMLKFPKMKEMYNLGTLCNGCEHHIQAGPWMYLCPTYHL